MSSDEFRLEQVLDHARRQEEQKQIELKTLSEEERRLREQLIGLREKEELQVRSLSQRSREGAIEPAAIDTALAYLSAIEGSISEQVDVVAEVEQRVLESREQLIAILKERQSLENLKRRQQDDAAIEERRRQSKADDDLTSSRTLRRGREA